MDVAQARPRIWTPQVILFSVLFHAVVIYYVAAAFNIVPMPPLPTDEPRTIPTIRIQPPPPTIDPDPVAPVKPKFPIRIPTPPPVPTTVAPAPIPAVVNPPVSGPTSFDVRGEVNEQPVAQPLPPYPRIAQDRDIEGRVVMSITIMPDGSVRDVRVVEARPAGYFERAAVSAVQRWRYRPSNVIRTNVIVHMDFELKNG